VDVLFYVKLYEKMAENGLLETCIFAKMYYKEWMSINVPTAETVV
jgi:hypothetical protein